MTEGQNWFIVWIVIARTAILIGLCLEYGARLDTSHSVQHTSRFTLYASRCAAAILLVGWISVVPIGVASIDAYTRTRLASDPAAPAVDLIRSEGGNRSSTIVFAAPRIFRRLYPLARSVGDVTLLPVDKYVPEEVRLVWLSEIAARGPFWLVAEEGDPETRQQSLDAEVWVSDHACKVDTRQAGSAQVSRFVGLRGASGQCP
jgi:hypothetical protein